MKTAHVLILAAAIVLAGALAGFAQQTTPAQVNGCIYLASPPTLTDKTQYPFTCDSTGKLRVTTTF